MQIEVYRMDADADSLTIALEAVCDSFSSLLWDIEYYQCGSFEVYIAANPENLSIFQTGRIVGRDDDSRHFGIIESVQIDTDAENGDYLTVRGRFLMCLLERRIIHPTYNVTAQKAYSEIVHDIVRQNTLLNDNRRIPGLSLGAVSGACWEQTTTLQVSYENLMEWVYTICEKIGGTANIRLVKDIGETYKMVLDLAEGTDRSLLQEENPHIIFSDAYSNLLSFSYASDTAITRNFAYIYGHGEGSERKHTTYCVDNEPTYLDRYELYVDAKDISEEEQIEGETVPIPEEQYIALLKTRGSEKLVDPKTASESEIAADSTQYVYNRDYFVGDYVTVEHKRFGMIQPKVQLIGMIEAFDQNGRSLTPTFKELIFMAFSSGFFNSKNLDRTYTAENFNDYLSSIICNGIQDNYGDCFKLTAASSGLKVTVGRGKAWINGHYFINDARYSIDLTEYQDESLPRYVGIAIYLDTTEAVRSVTLKLFPGTPAESPQLPSIPQDADHVRLLMYAVRLNPGAESLTERDWYDYREDRNVCGYCRCILGKCKVTDMLAQLAQITAEIQGYNDTIAELTNKVDTLQTEVDDIIGGIVEIGSCGENIHYVLYENGKLLLHGTGETYDYQIGQSPFWENEDIRNLVVSDGITKIGNSLFERCKSMASASFPASLTEIGERAFFMYNQGGITSLSIPPSVRTLGEKAFVHFNGTTVTLPATLTTLGTYLFMDSRTLTSTRVECEEVPGFCFVGTPLQSLTLSNNVKKLGSHMINYTPLHELTYEGSLDDWAAVTKGGNWDNNSGQDDPHGLDKVQCLDGYMEYDRENREWKVGEE